MKTCDDCGAVIVGRSKRARLCSACQAAHYRVYQGIRPRADVLCRVCGRAFTPTRNAHGECPHCYAYETVELRRD